MEELYSLYYKKQKQLLIIDWRHKSSAFYQKLFTISDKLYFGKVREKNLDVSCGLEKLCITTV